MENRIPVFLKMLRCDKGDRMSMPTQTSREPQKQDDYVTRFFGGPPLSVIFRLALLSILVGVILEALGFDPWNIIDSIQRLVQHIWDMGFDAVRFLWRYLLLGAAVVVPIWLLLRLARAPRGR
jgi:hypothetical protein